MVEEALFGAGELAANISKLGFIRGERQTTSKRITMAENRNTSKVSEVVYCYNCDLPAGPVIIAMVDGRFAREVCSNHCKVEAEGGSARTVRKSQRSSPKNK